MSASWTMRLFIFTSLFLAMIGGKPLRAALISHEQVFSNLGNNGASLAAVFPQFDPSLGNLVGAEYQVDGAAIFSVANIWHTPVSPEFNFSKGLTLNGTGLAYRSPGSTVNFDASLNWAEGELLDPGEVLSRTLAFSFVRTPDLGLGPFIGESTVMANIGVSQDSDFCFTYHARDEDAVRCTESGGLTLRLLYDYEPAVVAVPEPRTATLVMLGILALWGRTRKRAA